MLDRNHGHELAEPRPRSDHAPTLDHFLLKMKCQSFCWLKPWGNVTWLTSRLACAKLDFNDSSPHSPPTAQILNTSLCEGHTEPWNVLGEDRTRPDRSPYQAPTMTKFRPDPDATMLSITINLFPAFPTTVLRLNSPWLDHVMSYMMMMKTIIFAPNRCLAGNMPWILV